MKAFENMPEDTPCHADPNEKLAYRAKFDVIRDITLPRDERCLHMLKTTELKEQELCRVDMERIALHDAIITASRVPKPSPEVVADAGYSPVYVNLKLRAVEQA